MQVIAGKARRTPLVAPKGLKTRPTSGRAKEALFSILSDKVNNARFLDLFCGSGAIGIEALSRGAEVAVFVDTSPFAVGAVNTNLAKAKLAHSGEVIAKTTASAISLLADAGRVFDIIFLDPPYEGQHYEKTLEEIKKHNILAQGGIIIAEADSKTAPNLINISNEFACKNIRGYGRGSFLFYGRG